MIEGAEGAKAHQLPVLAVEATAPESGNFHWGHFFRQALGELEAPFLKDKVEYAASTAYFDRAGNYVIKLRASASDLRLAVEQSLRYRRPRAVIIDEAQHLTKISSGRRLQEQMDVLHTHTPPTQLSTQSVESQQFVGPDQYQQTPGLIRQRLHFPRYGSEAEDLKAFQSVLYGFQRRLPVAEEPDLLKHWEYCYVRSIGCVGILKDWLVRALGVSIAEGNRTVSMRHLEETALSVWQCEQIAREVLAGEERLSEKPGSMNRLTEMLGLVLQRMATPSAMDDSPKRRRRSWKGRDQNGESGSGSPSVIPLPDRRTRHSALRASLSMVSRLEHYQIVNLLTESSPLSRGDKIWIHVTTVAV